MKKTKTIKAWAVVDKNDLPLLAKEKRLNEIISHWPYAIFETRKEGQIWKKDFCGSYAKSWRVKKIEIKPLK